MKTNRILSFLLTFAIVLGAFPTAFAWDGTAATSLNGNGTAEAPYEISTAAELALARDMINAGTANTKYFKLTQDIDYNNCEWTPIGNETTVFLGSFDGDRHVIKNLKLTAGENDPLIKRAGFFGVIGSTATVTNLGISGFALNLYCPASPRAEYIGGFAAVISGTVKNCYIKDSTVVLSRVDRKEGAGDGTGAFASMLDNGAVIENCYTYNVGLRSSQTNAIAGFFAKTNGTVTVKDCYAAGTYYSRENTSHTTASHDGALYGFGGTTSATGLTVTNCWGTTANAGAGFTGANHITLEVVNDRAKGTAGATKEQIVAGLVDATDEYCAWTVTAGVNDGYPTLTYIERPDPDKLACETDAAALTVPASVNSAFTLPTTGANGTTITWSSNNTDAITITDGNATVICGDTEVNVTLTAIVTKNGQTAVATFPVTVGARVVTYVKTGELATSDNGDGTVTVSLPVEYRGLSGKYTNITFMAVLVDSQEVIIDRAEDTKTVGTAIPVNETFTATIDAPSNGQQIRWHLWGDGNVSLIDNAPSLVANLNAASKAKGVVVTWDASYDDGGEVVEYEVYKGDTLLDTITENVYVDAEASVATPQSYKIIPIDSNDNDGKDVVSAPALKLQMNYNNPSSEYGVIKKGVSGNDSYYITKTVNVGGVDYKVYATDISSRNHYIYFQRNTNVSEIETSDAELVFEIDYVDAGTGPLTLVYNRIIGANEADDFITARQSVLAATRANTNTLKTAVVRVSDAALRESGSSSGSSFGILIPKDTPIDTIMIKEIRVCKASYYE